MSHQGAAGLAPAGPAVVSLGQVAARLALIDVPSNYCDRRGRLCSARLLAVGGVYLPVPTLLRASDGLPAHAGGRIDP
jgi:hypothetical protein